MIRWPDQLLDMLEPIESVKQHPDNPNNGDVEAVIESIEVNGYTAPCLAQRSTTYILDGNTRYEALLALDSPSIPIIWLDVDDDTADRILAVSNQLVRRGRNDPAALAALLDRINGTELGLLGTGYSERELAKLRMLNSSPLHLPEPPPALPGIDRRHGLTHRCPNCGHVFG